jgi:hypothetical protein
MGESSLIIKIKNNLSDTYPGTVVLAYSVVTYSDVEARSAVAAACFNIRLYFHGLSPLSMNELPTDTPFQALHVMKARRHFPWEFFTILLYSCQVEIVK